MDESNNPNPGIDPESSTLPATAEDDCAMYQGMLEAMPGIVFLFNAKGQLLAWNRNLENFSGMPQDQLSGVNLIEVIHPEDRISIWKKVRTILRTGQPDTAEIRLIGRQQRKTLFYLVHGNRVTIKGRNCIVGIAIDYSARKMAERELSIARKMLLDRNENLMVLNNLFERLQGYLEVESIVQATLEILKVYSRINIFGIFLYNPESRHFSLAANRGFDEVMASDGGVLPSSGSLTGLALAQGTIVLSPDIGLDHRLEPSVRQLLLARDINAAIVIPLIHFSKPLGSINLLYKTPPSLGESELKTFLTIGKAVSTALANTNQLESLQHRAYHDSLTGLPNRLVLHEQFGRLADAMEAQGSAMALLLLDLDYFKKINDTLGHDIGDNLLREIALRLKSQTAGHEALIYRLDGDEFLIVLQEIGSIEPVIAFAESLLAALRKPFEVGSLRLEVGGHIGITIAPRDGGDSRALLRCADIALSEARKQGQGVSLYNRTLDRYTIERQGLIAEIGDAIRTEKFCLHYQPKLDLKDNSIRGFEALVRWQHPRYGLLLPGAFLPLMEVSEAIHRLTHEILRLGLEEQRRWREAGKTYSLSVNLSVCNLSGGRFLNDLEKLMRQYEAVPESLELEIAENTLMNDPEDAARLFARLSDLGIRLAIDSYGAGHSSLAFLRRLPIHTLKIDQLFIQNITESPKDRVIVGSTIDLAHTLGLEVVAKGVEKAATQSLLKEMGCDLMQGYQFCPPKSWRELERWLQS